MTTPSPGCLLIGGIGAFVAAIADITAKGAVSTVAKVANTTSSVFQFPVMPIYVVAMLVVLGVVLTYASRVSDLMKSLYVGASVITLFMTIVPNGLPDGLQSPSADPGAHQPKKAQLDLRFSLFPVAVAQQGAADCKPSVILVQAITRDGGAIDEMVVSVRDANSGTLVAQTKFTTAYVRFKQAPGDYRVVVDVPGYDTVSKRVSICDGDNLVLSVPLTPTWKPEVIKRLFGDY